MTDSCRGCRAQEWTIPIPLGTISGLAQYRRRLWEYLAKLCWPDGFLCPKCGVREYWRTGAGV
ncbi:transposase [Arthrobacter sp. AZCC_0090]|uniref:transposase n=1 Tax=Arthrobacter sp. AZCC_0090 TaxID=2735881 RepID=UPI00161113EA